MREHVNTSSGIAVSEETALHHSPIWSGVFQLAGDVAKLPLSHNRVLANGGRQVFAGKLHAILHDKPNPEMTSFKFRECMQALCLLYGNAYAEIIRDAIGRVAGLYPIAPPRVTPVRQERTGRLVYRVQQPSGGQVLVPPENMIHLSSLSTDGILGQSITEHARESIALGLATEKFGATFFGNGSTFGGVVEVQQMLNGPKGEEVKANIRSAIEAVHSGVERAHKILVLGGGAKFNQRGTNPNEAQFIETRKFQIQETSRWLVMPPHKLGDLDNAHFTNIEESEIQYWKGTVHRWLKMWEQELQSKLIPALEQNLQSIDFNMEAELRGTSQQRAAFYKEMHGLGVYTVNMILEKEGLPTIGPDGDRRFVPMNTSIPLDRVDEYVDSVIKKNQPPKPPELPVPAPKPDEDNERILNEVKELAAAVTRKLEQDVVDATAKVAEAEQRAAAAQAAAEAVTSSEQAARAQAEQGERQAKDDAAAARVGLEESEARLTQAQSETETVRADAEAKQALINAAMADVVAKTEALRQAEAVALERTEAARVAAEKVAASEAVAQERAAEAERLLAEVSAAVEARDLERARVERVESELADRRKSEQARLVRVVTSHRALVLDVFQRVARTETERARRRAANPDQLRKWADAFYDDIGRDICADMLVPAIQTHLAWKGSDEDPRAVARAMANDYYDESVQQIRTICEGFVGDEYHASVTRMLERWERERPHMVADKVVRDEIAALVSRS
jgi:HK97 family phage portal protein